MTEIISVRFKPGGKQYYFDPQGQTVKAGQGVVLETARGLEYGECTRGNHMVPDETVVQPLRVMVRIATEKDRETVEQNHQKEKHALKVCQEKIKAHALDMHLVDAEYSFEGNKILFFFTSEGRVDFRELVKDLAASLHARIELRQIGVRDEARMLGGLGICGKPFCCAQFLDEFQPVSIKMAKTQNLSLNPTKISGTCGRLMCCLKYEQDAYEDAVKRCPKQESFVETPDGVGTVTNVNLLREQVKVALEDSGEAPRTYSTEEIAVVRSGKGKRPEGYVAPPPEELAKLRKITPENEAAARLGERSRLTAALDELLPTEEGSAVPAPEKTGEGKTGSRRRRSRSRSAGKSQQEKTPAAEKPAQEKPQTQSAPKQKQNQKQKPRQEAKPAQETTAKQAQGEKKEPAAGSASRKNANRRRRHHKPKPRPEGSAPRSE